MPCVLSGAMKRLCCSNIFDMHGGDVEIAANDDETTMIVRWSIVVSFIAITNDILGPAYFDSQSFPLRWIDTGK